MRRTYVRRFAMPARVLFAVTVATLVAGATALATAPSASAAEFPTYGSGVNVRSGPTTTSGVVDQLATGETIEVDCQAAGETVTTPDGTTSAWWAHVPEYGGYVTVAYVDVPEDRLPGVPECVSTPDPAPEPVEVTYTDLTTMFPGKVGDQATVEDGLPGLNAEMAEEDITTPYRQAAFLATLANESVFLYNADQGTGEPYTGRGYIQLTGDFNYEAAGADLGVDLLGSPDLAASLEYSAPIAGWYWTVARDINPMADALDMGRVNAAIGYAIDPDEDVERCDDFKAALQHLAGSVPEGINCVRPPSWTAFGDRAGGSTREMSPEQFEPYMNRLLREVTRD